MTSENKTDNLTRIRESGNRLSDSALGRMISGDGKKDDDQWEKPAPNRKTAAASNSRVAGKLIV